MSLNDRITAQRRKLAAAKRRLKESGKQPNTSNAIFNATFQPRQYGHLEGHLETKNNVNGGREDWYSTTSTGKSRSPSPSKSPSAIVGAKVRASGVLRTPQARHADFRRMSSIPRSQRYAPPSPSPSSSPTTSPTYDSGREHELRQQRVSAHLNLTDPEPNDLHSVLALREQLQLTNKELKAAKKELNFTGDIMDMLRADIAKTDAKHAQDLILVHEAKDMKLRAAAEVDVLNEQISTRDRIVCELKSSLATACSERDEKEKKHRELREEYDALNMDQEIQTQRYGIKIKGVEEELVVTQELHQGVQKRMYALERDMAALSKDNSAVEKDKKHMDETNRTLTLKMKHMQQQWDQCNMRLTEATMTNKDLEIEINHTKGLVSNGNSDANKRSAVFERRVEALASENETLKDQLIESLAKETSQNSRIAELEQELMDVLNEKELDSSQGALMYGRGSPLAFGKSVSSVAAAGSSSRMSSRTSPNKKQLAQLKASNIHLDAELISTQQHLQNREEQIDHLKQQLYDAEHTVENRRQSIARRDSIGARQAATLSLQLVRSESALEVMAINCNNVREELKKCIDEKKTVMKQLNETRALNNARKEDYMYAKEDVLNVEGMLKEAREEVGIQKNIVRSQNRRLEMVEQHLMASKTESEHSSFELNKIRNKMKLYQKEHDQTNKYQEQVTALKEQIQTLMGERRLTGKEQQASPPQNVAPVFSSPESSPEIASPAESLPQRRSPSPLYHVPPPPQPPSSKPPSSRAPTIKNITPRNSNSNSNSNNRTVAPPPPTSPTQRSPLFALPPPAAPLSAAPSAAVVAAASIALPTAAAASTRAFPTPLLTTSRSPPKAAPPPPQAPPASEQKQEAGQPAEQAQSSISSNDAWLVITVELEKGESRDIEVRYGDNPTLLATNFCLQEGLSSEAVPSIANYIADHIAEEQAQMDMIEEAEEDEGSGGGSDVY